MIEVGLAREKHILLMWRAMEVRTWSASSVSPSISLDWVTSRVSARRRASLQEQPTLFLGWGHC